MSCLETANTSRYSHNTSHIVDFNSSDQSEESNSLKQISLLLFTALCTEACQQISSLKDDNIQKNNLKQIWNELDTDNEDTDNLKLTKDSSPGIKIIVDDKCFWYFL